MTHTTDDILNVLTKARREMPADQYEHHPLTQAVNAYPELRRQVTELQAQRDALMGACETAYRYLKVEIPYSPTAANDDRFDAVTVQLRTVLEAAGSPYMNTEEPTQ